MQRYYDWWGTKSIIYNGVDFLPLACYACWCTWEKISNSESLWLQKIRLPTTKFVLGLGSAFEWWLCYFSLLSVNSSVMLFTYSEYLATGLWLYVQLMFVISIDVVVYYLIRKGPLKAFKWYHFYVIELTISWDISKTKKNTIGSIWALIWEFGWYVYHLKALQKHFRMVLVSTL